MTMVNKQAKQGKCFFCIPKILIVGCEKINFGKENFVPVMR